MAKVLLNQNSFGSPMSAKSKKSFVQDSPDKLSSPFKLSHFESKSPKAFSSALDFSSSNTTKSRPKSSKGKESPKSPEVFATQTHFVLPTNSQDAVHCNLKDGLITLKATMKEYEEKQKEKKTLKAVVEKLKLQNAALKHKKDDYKVTFEKLHRNAVDMHEASITKENQRKVLNKSVVQTRDSVINHNTEIQESIGQNVEIAKLIKDEQDMIIALQEKISEMKQIFSVISKEKDKLKGDAAVSSKLLKTIEEKYAATVQEKTSYLDNINYSKTLKNN